MGPGTYIVYKGAQQNSFGVLRFIFWLCFMLSSGDRHQTGQDFFLMAIFMALMGLQLYSFIYCTEEALVSFFSCRLRLWWIFASLFCGLIHTCNFQSSSLRLYAPGLELLCGFQGFIILLLCHCFSLSEDIFFCVNLVLVIVTSFLI